jgi:hypothetical protein
MSSILKVDQIQLSNGNTPTAGDLGLNDTGTVIQTVSYTTGEGSPAFTNSTTVNVTSGQNVIIGSGTITPKYATSKILVTGFNMCHNSNTGYTYMRVIRTLGGTSTIIQTPGNAVGFQINSGVRIPIPVYILDSPSTTSQVTYSHRVDYHGGTVNQDYNYGAVNLTLMEIAG